jgi:hypothetical protein
MAILLLTPFAATCGTPREKTAPCKRPPDLASYAEVQNPCGPTIALNTDAAAAYAAIQQLAGESRE